MRFKELLEQEHQKLNEIFDDDPADWKWIDSELAEFTIDGIDYIADFRIVDIELENGMLSNIRSVSFGVKEDDDGYDIEAQTNTYSARKVITTVFDIALDLFKSVGFPPIFAIEAIVDDYFSSKRANLYGKIIGKIIPQEAYYYVRLSSGVVITYLIIYGDFEIDDFLE